MNSIAYFLLFVVILVSDIEATKGKGGGGYGGMSYGSGGGGYGAAPQQIIYVPAPQPVFYQVPAAPRPVIPIPAPSYGGGGYGGGSQGGYGGGGQSAPVSGGYDGSSGGSPVHVHVHSAPAPVSSSYQSAPIAPSYQPQIPVTSYGGGHGGGHSGGYQGSTDYGSAPVSYHQAPSVDSYSVPPQAGGY